MFIGLSLFHLKLLKAHLLSRVAELKLVFKNSNTHTHTMCCGCLPVQDFAFGRTAAYLKRDLLYAVRFSSTRWQHAMHFGCPLTVQSLSSTGRGHWSRDLDKMLRATVNCWASNRPFKTPAVWQYSSCQVYTATGSTLSLE